MQKLESWKKCISNTIFEYHAMAVQHIFKLTEKELMMNKSNKSLALAVSSAFALSIGAAAINAAENPFAIKSLSSGYQVADNHEKAKDGKCGEGKCGHGDKAKDGKCGEGKCGEGKCGESMKKEMKDGKCGEGKCGEGMKK
jgi:uncharacterized low-complexity protein